MPVFSAAASLRRWMLAFLLAWPLIASAEIDVEVRGVSGAIKLNAEAYLSIRDEAKTEGLDQAAVERLHRRAGPQLRESLRPFGYYNPFIDAALSGEAPKWKAVYTIEPGTRTTLKHVDLQISGEGAELLEDDRQRILKRLDVDAPLAHADYDQAKAQLATAAYAKGLLDANYTQSELQVTPAENTAEIVLHFETGAQYRFGEFTVEQQPGRRQLDNDFLHRYVPIRPGKPYDPQVLLKAQFALSDLGYFDDIEVIPQREAAVDRVVPILIKTTPRKSQHYDFGVGYGTDTGVRGLVGAEFRQLNDTGHTLRLEAQVSEIKNTAYSEYRIPVGNKAGDVASLSAQIGQQEYKSGKSEMRSIGVGLARSPGKWQRRYSLTYLHEESELGEKNLADDSVLPGEMPDPEAYEPGEGYVTADLVMPGMTLNRSRLDDPIYARVGWSLFADVHGAVNNVFSTVSFLQTHAILRAVLPLGTRVRLLGRYEYGANFVEDFGRLPASQRFFAGGDQSVRGYDYQSIGPRDKNDDIIGGNFLTTASGEAELRVWREWGVAAFLDAGGVSDDPAPPLHFGVGAGVRYRAPVGSIQIDLAHPLDKDKSGIRFHLGVRVGL